MEGLIFIIGLAAGLYMAWNIGANDVANGMASPVGAKAITLKQAVYIGAILDFVGATLIGSHVSDTIRKGIVDPSFVSDPRVMSLGLLSAILASSSWVFLSTWRQIPVSTTHSIVGAMVGFGIMAGGVSVIRWGKVLGIILSWIVSPVFACLLGFLVFQTVRIRILSKKDVFRNALRWGPLFGGFTFTIIMLSMSLETPLGSRLGIGIGQGVLVSLVSAGLLTAAGTVWLRRTVSRHKESGVEEVFRRLQLLTACYVALAHGANDVANAIGPLAGIYIIYVTHAVSPQVPVPMFLLALGGAGIAVGAITWGYRVIDTLGHRITELTNTRGFSVDFGVATSVLLASKLGLPVSTTHAAVGAVVGVGLARGLAAVDFGLVLRIFLYWIVTLPVSAISCMIFFKVLTEIF
ncbi:MAG: inorganic phosphate transporter [Thermodesulfobacteriota bacterium]